MTAENWEFCQARVRAHEGGNDDDPRDPGGRTSRGIIQREWTRYAAAHPGQVLPADVWKAPESAITDIYRTKYWLPMRCNELPSGVDDTVYDYAITSGVSRSGKVLRRVVGLPDNTGVVTDEVLRAVARRDPKAIINAINIERLAFLKGLKTWPVFGHGWARRVDEVNSVSLRLASHSAPSSAASGSGPPIPHIAPAPGKGVVPAPAGIKKLIVSTGAAAPIAAGGGFTDWIVTHPIESAALGCGIAVIVGGSLAVINRRHQRQQDAATPATPLVPELATPLK